MGWRAVGGGQGGGGGGKEMYIRTYAGTCTPAIRLAGSSFRRHFLCKFCQSACIRMLLCAFYVDVAKIIVGMLALADAAALVRSCTTVNNGPLRDNRIIVMTAAKYDCQRLLAAFPELRGDREVMLVAIGRQSANFVNIARELQSDMHFVAQAVKKNPRVLQFALEMRSDRFLMLEVVGTCESVE
jgi:hypothetical protein